MRYSPFDKDYDNVEPSDLVKLKEVMEGWYVEYKSQLPNTRSIAKSLSSFANQYGGWLFLGIDEEPHLKTAGSFPGIGEEDLSQVLEDLRNASKDLIRPQVTYRTRILDGPIVDISLPEKRSVVLVHVPEGSDTPYIHNDGRIYIRIGDSSTPIPANDKATFDMLYQRGEDRRSYLSALVERSPELSRGEENSSFIHLSILSDPYETLGHWYEGMFSDFSSAMQDLPIPFDNIYTSASGFVARQVGINQRYNRLFTWEFSRNCSSFISIPINVLPSFESNDYLGSDAIDEWNRYSIGKKFAYLFSSRDLGASRILNLNLLLTLLIALVDKHCKIVRSSGVKGPFYIKARIENVWRTVPFIDLNEFMEHIETLDFPVVQESDFVVPEGTSLDTFVVCQELDDKSFETNMVGSDGAVEILFEIVEALGIPSELLRKNAINLVSVSQRESEFHRARQDSEESL